MISDSGPWKDELLLLANRLESRIRQRRWTDRTSFLAERDVMVGTYAVRKLLDTPGKVSDQVRGSAVGVHVFPMSAASPPDFWSAYKFWEHYDLESDGTAQLMSFRLLCNQVVHSLIFSLSPFPNGEGLKGFFVASDRMSRESLIFVTIPGLVTMFRAVGQDTVVQVDMRRDGTGVMRVTGASSA